MLKTLYFADKIPNSLRPLGMVLMIHNYTLYCCDHRFLNGTLKRSAELKVFMKCYNVKWHCNNIAIGSTDDLSTEARVEKL